MNLASIKPKPTITYIWVAESKALKGCVGQGENFIDAIKELEENEQE